MYVLFFEDDGEFAGVFHSKSQAMMTAGLISGEKSRSVVAIFNDREGNTFVCFRYERGEKTFEAGCCPSAWSATPVAARAEAIRTEAIMASMPNV